MLDKIVLRYPVQNPKITQGFGENPEIYAKFGFPGHNGIDFGAPMGTDVFAAQSGSVKKVGYDPSGYGNYIILSHKIGNFTYETLYAHLSEVDITTNDYVSMGEPIGKVGNTGFSTGPHLHFELRVSRELAPSDYKGRIDPISCFIAISQPVPAPETKEAGDVVRVCAQLANIRNKTDLELSSIIGQLKFGTELNVIEREGDFFKCSLQFYVHKSVVS